MKKDSRAESWRRRGLARLDRTPASSEAYSSLRSGVEIRGSPRHY